MQSPRSWPGDGLVLVAPGGLATTSFSGPEPGPAERLAALLGLRLLPVAVSAADDPSVVLQGLSREQSGWLLPLSLDPGQDLALPGCWADALGAWRQPVLLLVPSTESAAESKSAAAPMGAARAYHALLQAAGVPLLGLVQVQGTWQPQQRRCDGLPWLGWLAPEGDPEPDLALRAAAAARWRTVSAARPDPSPCCPPVAANPQP
jgi:hypothetical protein